MNKFTNEVKKYLLSISDKNYLDFSRKLNMKDNKKKQLGIRIPLLRKYAKELRNKYTLDYLFNNIDEEYYEELMLKGFIIGSYKNIEYKELENYIKLFVPKISDWGICDTFCASLKITKKYYNQLWVLINKYLKSNKEYVVRFGLVMILNYYLSDKYIEDIYKIINNIKLDKYYVKMANAWLISYLFIKYFDRTYIFLKNNKDIDKWTYNKAIQKSLESYRISKSNKDKLRNLRK